jgi:hypothetical protein
MEWSSRWLGRQLHALNVRLVGTVTSSAAASQAELYNKHDRTISAAEWSTIATKVPIQHFQFGGRCFGDQRLCALPCRYLVSYNDREGSTSSSDCKKCKSGTFSVHGTSSESGCRSLCPAVSWSGNGIFLPNHAPLVKPATSLTNLDRRARIVASRAMPVSNQWLVLACA